MDTFNKIWDKYVLWIDDTRGIPMSYIEKNYHITWVLTYEDAIKELKKFKYDIIDLDHDLGEEKSGYDICKYIIENNIKCSEFRIHTMNPVGRENMMHLLKRYTNALVRLG